MTGCFKLVALRIFDGCDAGIKKCLQSGRFYYFCNDYIIKGGGKQIERASKYNEPLSDDFFLLNEQKKGLNISLQAVVGMNGDGKSSLVEIVLRLINNFSISRHIHSVDHKPLAANNVSAELYYIKDGTFYCLSEQGGDIEGMNLWKYKVEGNQYIRDSEVPDEELQDGFFYTLVSNYSHYAYNTIEYQNESSGKQDEDCWLYHVFHKNDGYQVPLSLHPYRYQGNIDINRERELTKPRLVSTIVRILMADDNNTYEFNGKTFEGLKLSDVGYSKFQERTLKDFFKNHINTRLLQKEIETLQTLSDSPEDKGQVENIVGNYIGTLLIAGNKYFNHKINRKLYVRIKRWAKENNLCSSETDVRIFLELMRANGCPDEILKMWKEFDCFNLCQIQRIELIDDICDQWRTSGLVIGHQKQIKLDINLDVLLKPYHELNDREKCLHYILYKTISIFETYESYGRPCLKYEETPFYFGDNPVKPGMALEKIGGITISRPFAKLSKDWEFGSHITLKLRQTYNFYQQGPDCTYTLYPPTAQVGNIEDGILHFKSMTRANRKRLSSQDQLPPAIYNWDLAFKANGKNITLESFSSGEKQKLFSLSAIVYHLQNLNSVANEKFKYHSINVILEEIELYFHPEWQRTFCNELMQMIRDANLSNIGSINVLFVTHSPYILSDIPKSNVLFLKDGHPENSMQENTFGANINSLLKNGFFMPSLPIGAFAHEKINDLFRKLHSGEFDRNELSSLRSEILMVGEPYIRQQLMTLLNMYSSIDEDQIKEYLRQIVIEKIWNNDRPQ